MRWLRNVSLGAIALALGGSVVFGVLALVELLIERLR